MSRIPKSTPAALFVYTSDGATHMLSGRVAQRLRNELAEGRGNPEITRLLESGYVGFMGPDGQMWDLDGLEAEHFR